MKFAILAVVVAMVALSEGYFGGSIDIGWPHGLRGYNGYRKSTLALSAPSPYEFTNEQGHKCVCTPPTPPAPPAQPETPASQPIECIDNTGAIRIVRDSGAAIRESEPERYINTPYSLTQE